MSAASRRAGARDNLDCTLPDRFADGDVFRRQHQKAGLDQGGDSWPWQPLDRRESPHGFV